MGVLIWVAMAIFIPELLNGESNPYREALLERQWESVPGYVTVRPGAHMFYWLYYGDGFSEFAERKPLIIWIQGFAASGVGNFAEIGPLTLDMDIRYHTWVNGRNVLFIDHPVGNGFSYVTNNSLLAKTDREIATDVLRTIEEFFERHKQFNNTPTYLFGQNYGGKTCTRVAYYLYKAIEEKRLKMNFKGVGIGGGWLDPKESILVYPEYVYSRGVIDKNIYLNATTIAKRVQYSIDKQDYVSALEDTHLLIKTLTRTPNISISFHNINQPTLYWAVEPIQRKMNTYVKPMLSSVIDQDFEWKCISKDVAQSLKENILEPSTKYLEALLNKTELKIAIYNGNLDMDSPVAGTWNWAHKLNWNGSEEFKGATQHQIRGVNNGFYKEAGQLSFWWVYGSGNWVPHDNPTAMRQILEYLIPDDV